MEPLDHLTSALDRETSLGILLTLTLVCVLASGFALALALEARRRLRDARIVADATHALRENGTILVGVVDEDGDEAVEVRLTERGREWSTKGGRVEHSWREIDRAVSARAFHVVTERGERVLVNPPRSVFLIDRLELTRAHGDDRIRERAATLRAGERVAITGRLRRDSGASGGGAYRDGPTRWVLDATPRGAMTISTEPLIERHETWMRFYALASLAPWVLALALHSIAYPSFTDFELHGRPTVGTILAHEATHLGTRNPRYAILVSVHGVGTRWETITARGYGRVGDGDRVVVTITNDDRVQLGGEPGIAPVLAVSGIAACVVAAMVFEALRRRRAAWWELGRVVTRGSGPLRS
jgi:hypothetical protein